MRISALLLVVLFMSTISIIKAPGTALQSAYDVWKPFETAGTQLRMMKDMVQKEKEPIRDTTFLKDMKRRIFAKVGSEVTQKAISTLSKLREDHPDVFKDEGFLAHSRHMKSEYHEISSVPILAMHIEDLAQSVKETSGSKRLKALLFTPPGGGALSKEKEEEIRDFFRLHAKDIGESKEMQDTIWDVARAGDLKPVLVAVGIKFEVWGRGKVGKAGKAVLDGVASAVSEFQRTGNDSMLKHDVDTAMQIFSKLKETYPDVLIRTSIEWGDIFAHLHKLFHSVYFKPIQDLEMHLQTMKYGKKKSSKRTSAAAKLTP